MVWLVPLAAAGAGSLALALAAGALKREVDELHRALRPLRTGPDRRRRSRS